MHDACGCFLSNSSGAQCGASKGARSEITRGYTSKGLRVMISVLDPLSKTTVATYSHTSQQKILASSFVREAAIVKLPKDRITNVAIRCRSFQPASIL